MKYTLIIPIILLTSCLTQKKIDKICQKCPNKVEVKDSIHEVIIKKDTTIYITQKGDSIFIPCDTSTFTKVIKKDGIKLTIKKTKKGIDVKSEADSLKVIIEGLNRSIYKYSSHSEVKVIYKEKELNWFQKAAVYWLYITLIIIAAYICYLYVKARL